MSWADFWAEFPPTGANTNNPTRNFQHLSRSASLSKEPIIIENALENLNILAEDLVDEAVLDGFRPLTATRLQQLCGGPGDGPEDRRITFSPHMVEVLEVLQKANPMFAWALGDITQRVHGRSLAKHLAVLKEGIPWQNFTEYLDKEADVVLQRGFSATWLHRTFLDFLRKSLEYVLGANSAPLGYIDFARTSLRLLSLPLYVSSKYVRDICPPTVYEQLKNILVPILPAEKRLKTDLTIFWGSPGTAAYPLHFNVRTDLDVFMFMLQGGKTFVAYTPQDASKMRPFQIAGKNVFLTDPLNEPDTIPKDVSGFCGSLTEGQLLYFPGKFAHQFVNTFVHGTKKTNKSGDDGHNQSLDGSVFAIVLQA